MIHDYGSSVGVYDARYEELQRAKYERAFQALVSRAPAGLVATGVLDAGCGTGLLGKFLADSRPSLVHPRAWYVGVDFSRPMLLRAREKLRFTHPILCSGLVEADCSHAPLRDRVAPLVVSFSTLQNVPEPVAFVGELKRLMALPRSALVVTSLRKTTAVERFKKVVARLVLDDPRADPPGVMDDPDLEDVVGFWFLSQKSFRQSQPPHSVREMSASAKRLKELMKEKGVVKALPDHGDVVVILKETRFADSEKVERKVGFGKAWRFQHYFDVVGFTLDELGGQFREASVRTHVTEVTKPSPRREVLVAAFPGSFHRVVDESRWEGKFQTLDDLVRLLEGL
ncbi:MAG: hypothetical protein Kow0069_06970 [Promethearchaeota archaeon]